jgi:hypothetical protein
MRQDHIKQVGEHVYKGMLVKTGKTVAAYYSRQNGAGGWTSVAQNARKQRAILDRAFRAEIVALQQLKD